MSALTHPYFQHPGLKNDSARTHYIKQDSANNAPTPIQASTQQATIIEQLENELWRLDTQHLAVRAFSCLIQPQVGDVVLYTNVLDVADSLQQKSYILSILKRELIDDDAVSQLSVPDKKSIRLEAHKIEVFGQHGVELNSAKDMSLNAPVGRLSISASHLLHSIQNTLIQMCKQMFNRSQEYDLNVEQLLKTHSRHQIITADKEIRMNADRINMG